MASFSPPRYSIVKDLVTPQPKHNPALAAKHQYLKDGMTTVKKNFQGK